ncbi:filamentous hemagglutinin N-terminal domain-containing protein [Pseudomonas sp. PDM22]|uniref:two-partner secretion domain-containing protein n=1 Tax=Pseudomonas sp. PDM22 TaxID=2769287 RepID=UPI00177B0DD5|nr:filamentous hemagglutinin N-terminal domain-containing protein [Pseudomonas sp. PDM22]MBD9516236.1 filamentous hemagglutinin N-terminal domain-containing protein [Pseudomonas sp. PDM22]
MDIRHPACQLLASVLSGLLILNPLVAAAAELAVDAAAGGNTSVGAAGNGVPVVNIATPNGAGLSHNKFSDYNVGQNGLILNNATGKTQSTQLGGIIVGNPNLKGGAANKILNEVTGANPSQLRGYTEVAGQAAHVIVANPHGITCNGCGFINTPRATLTTGKPILDAGRLQGYDVNGGEIAIEGAGLNAGNVDRFELITRSAKINADLHANQLTVVVGRNQVDAESLVATAKPDDGSAKPQLAIDSSALGGMYAGAIRLVGTEHGVGVKLAGNMAASAGDIQIDANGQLSLAQTAASGSLRAKAQDISVTGSGYAAGNVELTASGALSNQGQLAAGSRVQLSAAQISNGGIVEAGVNPDSSRNALGDVAIATQTLRNSGSVVASRNLEATVSGTLDNAPGASLRAGNTTINTPTLNNQGRVLATNALNLSGQQLSNRGGEVSAAFLQVQGGALDNRLGLFTAAQALNFTLGTLDNSQQGTLSSGGTLVAQVDGVLNNSQGGRLLSDGGQHLRAGQLSNQGGGVISSQGELAVQAAALDNRGGQIVGDAAVNLSGGSLDNRDKGRVVARRDLHLALESLTNAGLIQSDAATLTLNARTVLNASGGRLAAKGNLLAQVERFEQNGGELLSEASLQVLTQQLINRQGGWIGAMSALDLRTTELFNQGAAISSRGSLTVQAASADNSGGQLVGDADLHVQADRLVNRGGSLLSQQGLSLQGATLDNSQGGVLSSQRGLSVELTDALDNQAGGQLTSEGGLTVTAAQVDNRAGTISSALALNISANTLNNQGGKVLTDAALTLATPTLDNRQGGVLSAKGVIDLRGASLLNSQSGRVLGGADLLLSQTRVDNSNKGRIEAAGRVSGKLNSLDQHGGGQLVSTLGIDLDFTGGSLDNSQGGLLTTPGQLLLRNLAQLNNSAGGEVSSQSSFALQVSGLNNQGGSLLSGGALNLAAQSLENRQGGWVGATDGIVLRAGELLNQRGEISSRADVNLDAGQLDNSAGRIASDSALQVRSDNLLNQAGDLIGQGAVQLRGGNLNNNQGRISSQGNVDLTLSGTLDNHDRGQVISEGALTVTATQVDNRAGVLSSAQALNVSANALNNQGGKVLTDAALNVTAATLDNRQGGVLSAKGVIDLRGTSLLNAQSGRILSGADLLLAYTQVDNSEKGRLEAAGQVAGKVRVLDQHGGGQLIGTQGIDLDFVGGSLDNSTGGLLATPGGLLLRNLAQLNNSAGGEISSQQSFWLTLAGLNNQGGRIVSSDELSVQVLGGAIDNSQAGVLYGKHQLTLRAGSLDNSIGGTVASQGALEATLDNALNNHSDGALAAGGTLDVRSASLNNQGGSLSGGKGLTLVTGAVNNQNGRITAQGLLNAHTGDLDNQAGILSGQQQLTLSAQNLDNRAGLITTQGVLDLSANRVDNRRGGELSAGGRLNLRVQQLIQQQGKLITGGDLSLDLAGGDLDNRGAVLSVGGLLRIDNLRHLDNRGGELSSANSFMLRAASIDNGDAGRIISAQQLTLNTGALRNANQGLLSGWQSLLVNAADLDNSAGGTLSSKLGRLDVTLSGTLDNHGEGALVSLGQQNVRAASLNNQGGYLSGQQSIDLGISDALDNSAGGLISAQQDLQINAGSLSNASGEIGAEQLHITAGQLDNGNGRLISQNDLDLNTGTLSNVGGQLASGGNLLLRAGNLDNRNGQLISQRQLELHAAQFDNRGGTLASQQALTLLLSGALINGNDGLVLSQSGNLNISAQRIDNQGGGLQAQQDISLSLQQDLANQGGRVLSQAGNLDSNSASLDNGAGGILASLTGALKLVTGWFSNNAGITQAQSLDITASSGLDNRSGHLSAVSGDNRLSTATLDNQGGGLYAAQTLALNGDNLDNQGGQIGATHIDFGLRNALNNQGGLIESSGTLTLAAASIDNQNGRLRALGPGGVTTLTIGYLDNRNGRLETANTDLALNLGGLTNDGGTFLHAGTGQFGVNAGQITQAGGHFITTGRLDINADSWSNSSVLQAGWLNLNVGQFSQTASGQLLASQALTGRGGNWSNDGLLASDGSLDIQLTGTYSGAGRVTSLGDLNLSASQLDISQGASVTGGKSVTLGAGTLYNYGRITAAGNLTANTGTLNNHGTFGSAGQLLLNTGDLLNDGEQNGALLFSGDDMTLRVGGTLTNRYADIYSLGNLDIAANDAGGWTTALQNISATLESLGDMSLRASSLVNRTDVFETVAGELVSAAIGVRCFDCSEPPQLGARAPSSHLVWVENYRGVQGESSPSAVINAGRHLNIEGSDLLNQASTIAASGNVSMMLDTFTNRGVAIGDYSVRRSFDVPYGGSGAYGGLSGAVSFWNQVMAYNAANDPGYESGLRSPTGEMTRPNLHFWNRDWDESLELVTIRAGGREATRFGQFGSIRVEFPGASPFADFQLPHYQPGALVDAPDPVKNATFFDELIVQTGGSSFINAVVQAGGNIAINATQNLSNSVIQAGIPQQSGTPRMGETGVSGNTATVVSINAQLPPDLAQQQVNPISRPGFSLPTGNNGLFRLSGQEGTQSGAQTIDAGGSYSFSGQTIQLTQRERSLDGASGRADDLKWNTTGISGGAQRTGGASDSAEAVHLNGGPQAPDSATAPSWNVAQVQGVPSTARPDNSHKYLIETNPELTSLKSFLSSDYLLGLLGYDPDKSQKRLGDGLYEQRLIRDAVVARTGQRYLAGITSDQDLFRYLMDNAIAYKDKVHLQLGVALSAEQVAALTHDLVWLEEATVNGEKVLVPVLYLAQADNRLGPNGALIQGENLSLISGGDLANQGTLRASGDLSATAANLSNSGLIEAAGRLDLLALDGIKNTQGGIIKGRDVSLIALTGDVLSERSITRIDSTQGNRTWTQSFADNTARIEAAGNLDISAGRDISLPGSTVTAGRDITMQAGRDINLHSVELERSQTEGRNYHQSTSQLSGDVSAGRDVQINAGRDVSSIASHIDAGRDIGISAGRDVVLASATDEQHSYSQNKKITAQEDHVSQQSTTVNAGGDVLVSAGNDLTLISSKINAGNEAYLVAGDKIEVLAANDSDYSLYDKKEKGSWGSKKTQRDEVTDVKAVGSEISAGGDITMLSGGDQTYQAAKLESGNDIAIVSGGAVTFEAVKDLHQEAHHKEDSDVTWSSSKGKGSTDETMRQSQLTAEGEVVIKAVDGLHIDLKQINQKNVSQTIDAMVQADPKLAWIKDAEARGDVDWRLVQEIHDSYKYSNNSLGAGPSLIISIVAAAYLGPVYGAMASNLAIGTINNGGDIGQGLQHAASADSLKGYAITAATAYVVNPYLNGEFEVHTDPTYNVTKGFNLNTWGMDGVGGFAAYSLAEGFAQSVMQQAAYGGSFADNLGDAMGAQGSGLAMALGFNSVGNWAQGDYGGSRYAPGSPQKVIAHVLMGGVLAEATGSDFKTGAMAAGANEAMANTLSQWAKNDPKFELMESQIVGVLAAMAVNGDVNKGAEIAKNATAYNSQDHDHDGKIDFNDKLQEIKEQLGKRKSPLDAAAEGDGIQIAPNTATAGGAFAAGAMGRIFGGGGKLTGVEFLPKATRYSAGQVEANITQSSAIKTLESSGYNKTISQDGTVTVLTNGEKTYRFYPSATSTGQPSASLTVEGIKKPVVKIRFSGQ